MNHVLGVSLSSRRNKDELDEIRMSRRSKEIGPENVGWKGLTTSSEVRGYCDLGDDDRWFRFPDVVCEEEEDKISAGGEGIVWTACMD